MHPILQEWNHSVIASEAEYETTLTQVRERLANHVSSSHHLEWHAAFRHVSSLEPQTWYETASRPPVPMPAPQPAPRRAGRRLSALALTWLLTNSRHAWPATGQTPMPLLALACDIALFQEVTVWASHATPPIAQ